ncbi:uncharacterized protein BXZ73DRAFT_77298 [Epithele typhae]|uniref:uncharacterized protein n=1 Tax=Epithele typhae TaxID=378194 RepID=UPI002007AB8A|nr:uncharacterized protein BXZ73DRAFT_77298 [Epithele typhae]KAH9933129.1 hypothetical protein BXZ73DRAFT_77298 [Epithele typhae]
MDGQETLSQAMDLMLKASPKTTRIKVRPNSLKERLELTGGFSKHVRTVAPGARSTGASVDNLHLIDAGLGMAMGESTAKRKIWADGLEARGLSEVEFGDETDFVGESRERGMHLLAISDTREDLVLHFDNVYSACAPSPSPSFIYGANEDTFNTPHAVDSPEIELVRWSSHADLAHGKPASDSIQDADQPLYQTLMEQPHTTATGLSPEDFQPDVDDLERYAASMPSDSLYRPSFDATPGLVLSGNTLCHDTEEVCYSNRAWFSGSGPELGVTASWLIQGSSDDTTLATRNPVSHTFTRAPTETPPHCLGKHAQEARPVL